MIALPNQIESSSRWTRRPISFDTSFARSTTATAGRLLSRPAAEQSTTDTIVSKLAVQREDVFAALRLVYGAYVETGLIEPNPYEMRATRYHLLSTTDIFLASRNEQLLGSLSLVRDGELGLPLEDVYADEVANRRRQGVTMAEVSCLAVNGHGRESKLAVVVQLMSHMAQFAARQGVDELLIAVHPHHVGFYERFTGFEVIGEVKSYSAVCNNPAVALALDLKHGEINHPRAHRRFFGNPLPERDLTTTGCDEATLAELHWIVELTNQGGKHPRRSLPRNAAAA